MMAELNTSEERGTAPESIIRVARNHNLTALMDTNLMLDDLWRSVYDKIPVIIACQVWRDGSSRGAPWNSDREDGHYLMVIGLDEKNVYFEDTTMPGIRGVIPREEFVSRWHDCVGAPQFNVNPGSCTMPEF
jgi:hypothetical protein